MKPLGSQLIAEFINCSEDVLNDKRALEDILSSAIKDCGLTLIRVSGHQFDPIGVTVVAVIGESHVVIHTYPEACHASIDIFTCSTGSHARDALLERLKARLAPTAVRTVELDRGNPLEVRAQNWICSFSSYGYETRYHIKEMLFSERSQYQQIDIIDNDNFGRMLFLDKDLQIAERDARVYNRNMVAPLLEAPSLGRVAILGGGDGGVLSELLKHGPEEVVLVDIDEAVVRASREHLRCICGDAFDQPNVEVVYDDANRYLGTHQGFDAIVYDLTMFPEALTQKERRTFLGEIFARVGNSLKKGGVVSLQCCSELDGATYELLTEILSANFDDIHFEKRFIPSFCETWVFASAVARRTVPKTLSGRPVDREARASI